MSDSEDSIGDLLCTQAPSIDERWVAQKPSKEKVTIKREKQKTDSDSISSDEESSESKKEKKPNIDFSDSESESEGWLRRTKGVSHSGYSHQWTVKDDVRASLQSRFVVSSGFDKFDVFGSWCCTISLKNIQLGNTMAIPMFPQALDTGNISLNVFSNK